MKIGRIITSVSATFAAIALAGCVRAPQTGRRTIPYVENMLVDSATVSSSLLNTYEVSSKGAITIVGPLERCMHLSETFMNYDAFDNVDGRTSVDLLPDFAGETIVSIMDIANSPYEPYISTGNSNFLRELNVRNFIMAIQDNSAISQYDKANSMSKTPAKVIIFTSSAFEDYGMFDVDTLCRALGKPVPVLVSPDDASDSLVVAECFKVMRQKNLFTHKVAAPTAKGYVTYPLADLPASSYAGENSFSDAYKYSRADNSGVDTYLLVGYSDRYLSEEDAQYIRDVAPLTYSGYVQD